MTATPRRGHWRPAAAALLALAASLLTSPVSASSGDLAVDHVTLQGHAVVEGPCRVLQYFAQEARDSASLTIAGEVLSLELDTMWANTTAGVAVVSEYGNDRDEFRNGTFGATAFRAGHSLFLADVPGRDAPRLQWTGASGRLEPSASGIVEQGQYATRGHPERSVDVQGAVSWAPAPGWTSLSVTGDFYVALWEVDGHASDDGHARSYSTGETAEGPTSGVLPLPLTVGRVEDRLLHVFAFNATLVWQFDTDGLEAFHVADAAVDSPAPILLSGATGDLRHGGSTTRLTNNEVRLASGRLEGVRSSAGGLHIGLDVAADAISVDGQPVVFPRQDRSLAPWAVAAAAAALTLALAVAWRWAGSGLRGLERTMAQGRYADVVARRAAGRLPSRHVPQANVLHAVSLMALKRHEEAGHFLENLPSGERPEPPTFSYLLAAVRAEQGRTKEAARLLRDCLEAAPDYLPEVLGNPSLLPLLQGAGRPRPLREGAEGGG